MIKMRFTKVSPEEWKRAVFSQTSDLTDEVIQELYDDIKLPRRATSGSAGYDLFSPVWVELGPGEDFIFPLGIRCEIDDGWFLGVFPRSGLGFKYYTRLANTTGIIDSDYTKSDNEGHIMMKLRNESADKILTINRGDAIAQAVFLPFGVTDDDDTNGIRNGGFGSTGA